MSNKRIFYASQSINLQPVSTGTADPINYRDSSHYVAYDDGNRWIQPLGLQSAGISTTFNNEPISQLGTLNLYTQTETVPEVEVTLSKVLDGTAPLYSICTAKVDADQTDELKSVNADITQVSTNMVNVRFVVLKDTDAHATGVSTHHTLCERMYISSTSFTFPVEGNATEEITLVGNSKKWGGSVTIPQTNGETPYGTGTDVIVRRQYVSISGANGTSARDSYGRLTTFPDTSIIPEDIQRFDGKTPRVQNITISANFNRENINELGFFGPYYKYTTFPLEVTSEFEVIAVSGDLVNANDFENLDNDGNTSDLFDCGTKFTNLTNREIVIKVCGATAGDTLYLDLGTKNKLTAVNYTGGDTGGGNATVSYSYQTFNKLNVIPQGSYADFTYHTSSSFDTGTLADYN